MAPSPMAPVTQMLIDAPLSPIFDIAQQPSVPPWLLNTRLFIQRVQALAFGFVGGSLGAVLEFSQTILTEVQRFLQIGPYGTSD